MILYVVSMRKLMLTSRPRPLLLLLLLLSAHISTSTGGDTLAPAQPLLDGGGGGQVLVSAGGGFAVGFFSPDGSTNRYVGIWYNNISAKSVVWVANRRAPVNDTTGSLSINANGSLTITAHKSTIIWSTAAAGTRSAVARILDNGNFVVGEAGAASAAGFAWQSFDLPADTLLPGMKLGWYLASGLNRNLTSWVGPTDPSPGPYSLTIDVRGDPQVFLMDGSTQAWRAGPWDGVGLAGLPAMTSSSGPFNFTFVDSGGEIYYSFLTLDPSVVARLVVNSTGSVQRLVWVNETQLWNVFWEAPADQCDAVASCGPYGVCDANDSPVCSCIQGFDPKFPANWALRDGTGGCVRRTKLDCVNGTDGFVVMGGVKVPDTSAATVDASIGLEECKARCLRTCSCTACANKDVRGGGSGCLIWTSELTDMRVYQNGVQDLYIRVAAADLGSPSGNNHKGPAVVGIVLSTVAIIALLTWLCCCIWRRKRRRRVLLGTVSFSNQFNNDGSRGEDLEMPLFDFDTIVAATNNFSFDNKLGEGGFGPVYKGVLGEGQEIGVKRLAKTSVQGLDEFKNEVVLIAKLQHRNLVRLLGCCIQREERMLVYEYMHNKSLDLFLFDKTKRMSLDWQTRFRIISGISRGLLYLHQDSRFRIIHRDLKASNILLDKEMNPKISDFGMARIFGGDETEVNTRKVVGTYGYMSPEYAMDGIFSVKSDVFSFGVLVLEIISGKKNRGIYSTDPNLNLLGLAWSLWKEGRGLELVDQSIGFSYPMAEIMRCIKVGLLCVQERPEDRPPMSSVILMLGSDNASLPNPREPGFVSTRAPPESDSSTSKQDSTANDMTVTIFEGR